MEPDHSYTVYTCPMHLDVRHTEPGVCIKCGRTLEPDTEDNDEL